MKTKQSVWIEWQFAPFSRRWTGRPFGTRGAWWSPLAWVFWPCAWALNVAWWAWPVRWAFIRESAGERSEDYFLTASRAARFMAEYVKQCERLGSVTDETVSGEAVSL